MTLVQSLQNCGVDVALVRRVPFTFTELAEFCLGVCYRSAHAMGDLCAMWSESETKVCRWSGRMAWLQWRVCEW